MMLMMMVMVVMESSDISEFLEHVHSVRRDFQGALGFVRKKRRRMMMRWVFLLGRLLEDGLEVEISWSVVK